MKNVTTLISFAVFILAVSSAYGRSKNSGPSFPAHYAGGSVALKQNRVVKAVVGGNEVIFVQHERRVSVPVQSISEISCAEDVHRRFGAAVLGRVPLVYLGKVQTHYVGLSWMEDTGAGVNRNAVLKLSGGEYRDFVATLERLTGKRPVDTRKTPTAVRYK